MTTNPKQYVHSTYFERNDNNYIVINEKDSVTHESKLVFKKNVKRPFYLTKEQYRDHSYKKEYEDMNKVDTYFALEHKKYEAASEALNLNTYRVDKFTVLKSPYIYGIDIPVQVLIKTHYFKNNPLLPRIKIGALDIEQSMLGGHEVIIFTYIHEDFRVFTSIYAPFLNKPDNLNEQYTIDDIKSNSELKIREYLDMYNSNRVDTLELTFEMLNIEYYISESELDLISWTFSKIHECKPDLCTIWNMDYDFPTLIERIETNNGILEDILCHPEVPREFRFVKYEKDNSNVDHITLYWHNVYISGYTRFVDGMCLYSRKRTVQGRDVSYTLQYIAEKEINIGKLELEGGGYHQHLQRYCFLNYIAYNQVDNIPLILMEYKNKDLMTLIGTLDNSLIEQYNRQSYRLTNSFYKYALDNKHVPCAAGSMETPFCKLIPSTGGLVLSPTLTRNTSVSIFKDFSASYGLHKYVADFDVAGVYPTVDTIFNICKETKISTCVNITDCSYLKSTLDWIDNELSSLNKKDPKYKKQKEDLDKKRLKVVGEIIENFFLNIITPQQNAITLGMEYFNLLSYEDYLTEYLNITQKQ